MDNFFDNDYVRVGLPVAMGIAAAAHPAGARGASALLSTLGGLSQMGDRKQIKRMKELELQQKQQEFLARQPSPFERVAQQNFQQTLLATQPPPDGAEGPPAPPTMEIMRQRLDRMADTEGGGLLLSAGAPKSMQSYVTGLATRGARSKSAAVKVPDFGLGDTLNANIFADWGAQLRQPDGSYIPPSSEMIQSTMAQMEARQQAGRVEVAQQTGAAAAGRHAAAQLQSIDIAAMRQRELRQEEQQARGEMTASQAEDAGLVKNVRYYYSTESGAQINPAIPYQQLRQLETDGRAIKFDDAAQLKEFTALRKSIPLLARLRQDVGTLYGPGGAFEHMTPETRPAGAVTGWIGRFTQTNPQLVNTMKRIDSTATLISRNLLGNVGVQTEQDVQRSLAGLPTLKGVPDTRDVAFGSIDGLLALVNGQMGALLGNPEFRDARIVPLGEQPTLAPLPGQPTPSQPLGEQRAISQGSGVPIPGLDPASRQLMEENMNPKARAVWKRLQQQRQKKGTP